MQHGAKHTIHSHRHHHGWDRGFEPALTTAPGETLHFETVDSSGGQLSPNSTVADVAKLDFSKVNPVSGPVYIDGARPGVVGNGRPSKRSMTSIRRSSCSRVSGPSSWRKKARWP
jgi:hypothetical protein